VTRCDHLLSASFGIQLRSCFAFDESSESALQLVDDRGCRVDKQLISDFSYDQSSGTAEASIRSMFRSEKETLINYL